MRPYANGARIMRTYTTLGTIAASCSGRWADSRVIIARSPMSVARVNSVAKDRPKAYTPSRLGPSLAASVPNATNCSAIVNDRDVRIAAMLRPSGRATEGPGVLMSGAATVTPCPYTGRRRMSWKDATSVEPSPGCTGRPSLPSAVTTVNPAAPTSSKAWARVV